MNTIPAASAQAPEPVSNTAGTASKLTFQLNMGTSTTGIPGPTSSSGAASSEETRVSLSHAGRARQALEQQSQPVAQAPFKPYDAAPPWLNDYGLILPDDDKMFTETGAEFYRRNQKYLSLSDDEKTTLREGFRQHYFKLQEANNLSSDNPRSHELLFDNQASITQYRQQFEKNIFDDPKLMPILLKMGRKPPQDN
nr:hypothetical protein [Herbaspirillum sp. ASV7]